MGEKGWSSMPNRLDGSMNAGKKKHAYISWHIWMKERRGVCVCVCCITGSLQPCQRGQLTFARLVGVGWVVACALFRREQRCKPKKEEGKGQRQWRERSVPIPTLRRSMWGEMALISSAGAPACWVNFHRGGKKKKKKTTARLTRWFFLSGWYIFTRLYSRWWLQRMI